MVKKQTKKSYPKTIKELKDPNTLKTGHIKRLSNNRYVVVKRDSKGNARYIPASKSQIKCDKTLKRNVSEMIEEVKSKKSKRIKTYPQALAIAYSKTAKRFPKCKLVNQISNKKTQKNNKTGGFFNIFNKEYKIKKYQKKILNILIHKGYIKDNNCDLITKKHNKIKHLLDHIENSRSTNRDYRGYSTSSYSSNKLNNHKQFIININELKKIYSLNAFLSEINTILKYCKIDTRIETINGKYFDLIAKNDSYYNNKNYYYYIYSKVKRDDISEVKKYKLLFKFLKIQNMLY